MTIKDLIKELLEYNLNDEVCVAVDYSEEKKKETGCKGAIFDIINIDIFGASVKIKIRDWREKENEVDH